MSRTTELSRSSTFCGATLEPTERKLTGDFGPSEDRSVPVKRERPGSESWQRRRPGGGRRSVPSPRPVRPDGSLDGD